MDEGADTDLMFQFCLPYLATLMLDLHMLADVGLRHEY